MADEFDQGPSSTEQTAADLKEMQRRQQGGQVPQQGSSTYVGPAGVPRITVGGSGPAANEFDQGWTPTQTTLPSDAPRTWWDTAKSVGQTADDFARAAANAATFGMADRVAGVGDAVTGPQTYNQAVNAEVARSQAARMRSPYTSVVGDVLGSLAIPAAGGAKLASYLGSKLGGRILGYGAEGAGIGALQGAGNTYTGNISDYLTNAGWGAGIGGVLGGAFGGAFGARPAQSTAPVPSTSDLYVAKTQNYDNLTASPARYEPADLANASYPLEGFLRQKNFAKERSPLTWNALEQMRGAPTAFPLGSNTPVSPGNIEYIYQGLGPTHVTPGTADAASAVHVRKALNDFVANPPTGAVLAGSEAAAADASALAQRARDNYGAYIRGRRWDDLVENAQNQAGGANSGLNIENILRQGVKPLIKKNEGRSEAMNLGYNAGEINAMRNFERGTTPSNVLRYAGNMLGGGSGATGPILGGLVANAAGQYVNDRPGMNVAIGAGIPVAGLGLRALANRKALTQINQMGDMFRQRSPLYRDTASNYPTVVPNPLSDVRQQAARNAISSAIMDNLRRQPGIDPNAP